MVKRFIKGENIRVTYEPDSDELEEFQQYLRDVLKKADRSVVVDLLQTVEVPPSFLKSLVLATRSLKIKGYAVTFIVPPNVGDALQNSQYSSDFIITTEYIDKDEKEEAKSNEPVMEIFQREDEDAQAKGNQGKQKDKEIEEIADPGGCEVEELEEVETPPIVVEGNKIVAYQGTWQTLKEALPDLFKKVKDEGHDLIILDLRYIKEFSSPFAKWLSIETISRNRKLRLQVTAETKKEFQKWGQGRILDMEVVPSHGEKTPIPAPILDSKEKPDDIKPIKAKQPTPETEEAEAEEAQAEESEAEEVEVEEVSELEALDLTMSEAELVCQMESEDIPQDLEILSDINPPLEEDLSEEGPIEEITEPEKERIKTTVEGNKIIVGTITTEQLEEELPDWVAIILEDGHEKVIIDLCNLEDLPPSSLRMLARETLSSGKKLHLIVTPELNERIQKWGKSHILSVEVFDPDAKEEEIEEIEEAEAETEEKKEAEAEPPKQEQVEQEPSKKEKGPEESFDFRSTLARLEVGGISNIDFRRQFSSQLEAFLKYRDEVIIDLTRFSNYDEDIARELSFQSLLARNKRIKLILKVSTEAGEFLRRTDQASILHLDFKGADKKDEDEEVKKGPLFFESDGYRLIVHNMNPQKFLMELEPQFAELLKTDRKEVVVDVSRLLDLPSEGVKLLVLCQAEAAEKGIHMKVWISPKQEGVFLTSGEARTIPIEIQNPEDIKVAATKGGLKVGKIKTSFLLTQLEKDRLTSKVLRKDYKRLETVKEAKSSGPERRKGTKYRGPERRGEKRVAPTGIEVAFGRGIAQISERRYPLVNISMAGARFTVTTKLPLNELLRLIIYLNNEGEESILLQAKVVWAQQIAGRLLYDTGVTFTHIPPDSKGILRQLVREAFRKNLMA